MQVKSYENLSTVNDSEATIETSLEMSIDNSIVIFKKSGEDV